MTIYLPVVPSRMDGFECIPYNKKDDTNDVFAQQTTSENKFKFYYDLSPLNQDSDYTHVAIKLQSVDSNFNPIVNKYSNGIYIAAKQSNSNGSYIEVPAHLFIQPSNTVAVGNINMDSTIPKIVTGTSPTTYRNILYSDYELVNDSGANDYYRSQIKLMNLTATNSFSYTSSKWVTVVKANTSVTTASAVITVSDINGLIVGLNASGGGLLDGVTIQSISGSSITLTANSNLTTTSNISFYIGSAFLNSTLGGYVSDWSYQTILKPVFISNLLGYDSQDKEYVGIVDFKSRTTTSDALYTASNTASAEFYPFQFQYPIDEEETLVEYEFALYDDTKTKIDGSGLVQTQKYLNQTSITWTNTVSLTDDSTYYLAIYFKTDSGFEYTKRYQFKADYTSAALGINFIATNDRDNGRIEFELSDALTSSNSLILLKSSFDEGYDNFKTVAIFDTEDLTTTASTKKYYYDYLIEPGILYRYKFQSATTNSLGDIISRGASTTVSIQPHIIPDFNGSFLYGKDDIQINFIYNGQISSLRETRKDAVIETIGAKYPYVIRNSNIGYKQFQFSAMITHVSDPLRRLQGLTYTELVSNLERDSSNNYIIPTAATNREINERYEDFISSGPSIFTSSTSSYVINTNYGQNNISSSGYLDRSENYLVEKQFRKKLISWLSDGNPKVFKSDTEGLILVKLTDISFEPVVELGRMIYNFSCTMTEVDELNYENLVKHGITKAKYSASDLYLISNINNFVPAWSANGYLPQNQYFYVQDSSTQFRYYKVTSTGTTGTTTPSVSQVDVAASYTSSNGTYVFSFIGYKIPGKF